MGCDICLLGILLDNFPSRRFRNPEDVDLFVIVAVIECCLKALGIWFISITLWVRECSAEFITAFGERVRCILKEDKAKDDVFVLCSVEILAQNVGGVPVLLELVRGECDVLLLYVTCYLVG